MLKNFILTTARNISKNKLYAFINIFGLSIGIASAILILLFISSELSYDKYHEKADRIYRLTIQGKLEGTELNGAYSAVPSGPAFKEEIPEVAEFCRMKETGQRVIKYDNIKIIEDRFVYADSSIFRIFDLNMIQGDPDKALTEPNTLVLTRSTAKKVFGNRDPINKMVSINADSNIYRVTGIIEDLPENTHLQFNALGSYHTLDESNNTFWLSNNLFTYLLFEEGAERLSVENKMQEVSLKYIRDNLMQALGITVEDFESKGNEYGIKLQALRDIHLNNEISGGFKSTHDKKYLLIFSFIAILILVIASINFMNLSTAKSANRAKEVGMRKVVGSTKKQLVNQFLWESIFLSVISLVFALILVELLLPYFNRLIGLNLSVDYFSEWYSIPALIILAVLVGLMSGSYPSFVLSAFKPVEVLKGNFIRGVKGGKLRNVLVILQFTISIIIIFGTIVVYNQLHFMMNKDMGFSKDQQLVIDRVWPLDNKIQTFIQEIEKLPGVEVATNSTAYPGHVNNDNGYQIKGRDRAKTYLMITNWTDYDYLNTYDIELKEGRFLSREFSSDSSAAVINETAVKDFNLEDPLNTTFIMPGYFNEEPQEIRVVGVVKDFHLASLRNPIRPSVFMLKQDWWDWGGYISLKLSRDKKSYRSTVSQIEKAWQEFLPNEPFIFFFLDEKLESLYKEEIRTARISLTFSILAILIASLGLFGLTLFTTEKKTREIGIRKVMGAKNQDILFLILKDISLLMLISTIVAWVAAYRIMSNWLQDFPYRTDMDLWIFIVSAGISFIVATITVSIQAYRAATANPANSLRHE
ncbi:MAG: ABC transporter permease [Bacteroidota bacterium]